MKQHLRTLAIAVGLLGIIGALVVVSGIVPVSASSGHWPITAWVLEFAMERSVSTHSKGIAVPPLDDEALIMRGAGHYEMGCYWCHGGPGTGPRRVGLHMTPHPPDLTTELTKWQPAELFTIVRHGVLFTGMPAWPSDHREDEVWAVVAFLQKFPEMKEHEYDDLSGRTLRDSVREAVRAPVDRPAELAAPQPPMVVIERCVACHAADGLGREAHPKVAGQSAEYLRASLDAYRQAARHSGTMGPIAVDLSDAEIEQSVSYYHSLAPFQPSASERTNKQRANEEPIAADDRLALGLEIATNGLLKEKAGACRECHGPGDAQRHARYPHLAGQDQDYLVQQLRLFRSNDRGGSDHAHIMHNIAESLSDEQISAVAAYYAALAIEPVEAANIPPRTTD